MDTARQLHEVAPALFTPSGQQSAGPLKAPAQIDVNVSVVPVASLPVHFAHGSPVPGSPPTGSGGVVARAWSEPPATGAAEPYCLWLVAVNAGSHATAAGGSGATFGQLSNYSLTNLGAYKLPAASLTASTPFQAAPSRSVPVLGTGDTRYIIDFLAPGEAVVYQIGCTTKGVGNVLPVARPAAPVSTNCGLINPSFEEFAVVGRPVGWDFGQFAHGVGVSGRDGRASILLTTSNPKHGRHALRVVVPTSTPLILPFSSSGMASDVGLAVKPGLTYFVQLWARSSRAGMRLDVVLQPTAQGVPDPTARTAPAIGGAALTTVWQWVGVHFVAKPGAGSLLFRAVGSGDLFLDLVQVNASDPVACCVGC